MIVIMISALDIPVGKLDELDKPYFGVGCDHRDFTPRIATAKSARFVLHRR